jgi:hypothetical protein
MAPPAPLDSHPDRLLIDEAAEARINPDTATATTHAELRGSTPRLVSGPAAVTSLFVRTRHPGPGTDART